MGEIKANFYKLREHYIPIVRLYQFFNIKPQFENITEGMLIIVDSGRDRIGIYVDELMSHQQVVIKSLEENYKRIEGISGATILWNGQIAMIIDVLGVQNLAIKNLNQYQENGVFSMVTFSRKKHLISTVMSRINYANTKIHLSIRHLIRHLIMTKIHLKKPNI